MAKIEQFLIIKGRKKYANSNTRVFTTRITKSSPRLDHDEIAVKLVLDIPVELFEKPALQAKVSIPPEAVSRPVIEADVISNVEDIIKQNTGFEVRLEVVNNDSTEN